MQMYTGRIINNETVKYIKEHFPPGLDDDFMLEIYSNSTEFDPYALEMQRQYRINRPTNISVFKECATPTFQHYKKDFGTVFLMCIAMRLLTMSKLPRPAINISFILFYAYHCYYEYKFMQIYVIAPSILFVTYILICKKRSNGFFLSVVAALYMLYCEYFVNPYKWINVKGNCMLTFMRIISVCFDIQKMEISTLGLLGYTFNPLSTVHGGVFVPYRVHQQTFNGYPLSLSWLYGCIKAFTFACIFIFMSNCGIEYYLTRLPIIIPYLFERPWWYMYLDSLGFRLRHYYDCYISEYFLLIVGIGTLINPEESQSNRNTGEEQQKDEKKIDTKEKSNHNVVWSYPNVDPLGVEWPRSIADLLPKWNITVHHFLKPYYFETTIKYGLFPAILSTYTASVLLHAGNFHFTASLMSAGIIAYGEGVFRGVLAEYFSACIKHRKCKSGCTHKYKSNSFWVICVNLVFTIGGIYLYAYATCIFDDSPERFHGYSMAYGLTKWENYGFIGHKILFTYFILYFILKNVLKIGKEQKME